MSTERDHRAQPVRWLGCGGRQRVVAERCKPLPLHTHIAAATGTGSIYVAPGQPRRSRYSVLRQQPARYHPAAASSIGACTVAAQL